VKSGARRARARDKGRNIHIYAEALLREKSM
jgi:hypothetical protein